MTITRHLRSADRSGSIRRRVAGQVDRQARASARVFNAAILARPTLKAPFRDRIGAKSYGTEEAFAGRRGVPSEEPNCTSCTSSTSCRSASGLSIREHDLAPDPHFDEADPLVSEVSLIKARVLDASPCYEPKCRPESDGKEPAPNRFCGHCAYQLLN